MGTDGFSNANCMMLVTDLHIMNMGFICFKILLMCATAIVLGSLWLAINTSFYASSYLCYTTKETHCISS